MEFVQTILIFVGSLGFLLYGMRLMSGGIQKSAGEKLQRALGVMTGNRFVAILTGLAITMIIQSSGATTVMVVSFINAGLLTLAQSVGVIFGANIGTTITAWIVALFGFNFQISTFAAPIFGLGFFLTFIKKATCRNIGEAVMGFGLLFMGLSGLSDVFSFDPEDLGFLQKVQDLGALSIFIGFIVGIFITALMHSSSAFSAIVITMAYNNIITWEVAAAMTLGSNVGSTIDAVLASVGTNADARRSAFIHVFFNVAGTVLALILFNPLLAFVSFLSGSMNIAIRISILHTVFKIVTTLCCLPFVPQIVRLSQIVIKDDTTPALKYYRLDFQENQIGKESVAMYIIRVEKEIADMTDVVTQMFNRLQQGFTKRNTSFVDENFGELELAENYCDQMHEQLVRYIIQCQQLPINNNQRNNLSVMIQVTDELEGMSDDCFSVGVLLKRSVEKKMKFLQEDMDRLIPYVELARQFLQFIRRNINKHLDKNKLEMASDLENQIDSFRKDLKKVARKRLESGADVKAELLYLDLVRQIEKIGDHAFSISELLVQTV